MPPRIPSLKSLASIAVLLTGVGLRTYQFVRFDSLWTDELSIALNVTRKGWVELLSSPLDYRMVAPVGFLAADKLGVLLLGPNEAGLRLFPYVSSLVALFLFQRLTARYVGQLAQVIGLSLFALSPALLWYARNSKQYSSDTAVVLILILLALRTQEAPLSIRRGMLIGILGGLAIIFSQPAALVGAGLIAVLLVQTWRARERLAPLAGVGVGWFCGATIVTVTSLLVAPASTRDFMTKAWTGFFFPRAWDSWSDFIWLPTRLLSFFGFFVGLFKPDRPVEILVAGAYGVLALIGLSYLVRRSARPTALLVVPPAVAVIASFGLLPLTGRVSIYMLPSLVLFAVAGLERMRGKLGFRPWHRYVILLIGMAPAFILPYRLPQLNNRQPARPVLEEMRSNWRPGDAVYVAPGGIRAMRFYGEPMGIEPWTAGRKHPGNMRLFLRDVDAFRDRPRVWIFFTAVPACLQETILSYLGAIGTERIRIEDPHGNEGANVAAAYLYALDDPTRARRLTARTAPIPTCARRDKKGGTVAVPRP